MLTPPSSISPKRQRNELLQNSLCSVRKVVTRPSVSKAASSQFSIMFHPRRPSGPQRREPALTSAISGCTARRGSL